MAYTANTNSLRQKIADKEGRQEMNTPQVIKQHQNMETAVIHLGNGDRLTLTPQIVRQYLVNGAGNVTDQEITMFLQLCRAQNLNPFLKEAYLIKYGNSPATIVTAKEVFTKRAERHPDFDGFEAGIYVVNNDGKVTERKGTMTLPHERVIGGWAKVYRKSYRIPIEATVGFDEYAARKGDGTLNQQWTMRGPTMIRKCALVAALREAFPDQLGGMYTQDESGMQDEIEENVVIDVPAEIVTKAPEALPEPQDDGQAELPM